MTRRSISWLLAVLSPLAACRAPTSAGAAGEPAIVEEWSGQQGGAATSSTRVARDAGEWETLWRQIGREAPRALDSARETAVAIFVGQRRTGGYAVGGLEVRREDVAVVVEYREVTPASDAMVTQVISSPWAVVVVSGAGAAPVTVRKVSSR